MRYFENPLKDRNTKKGFTLIELMVVVGIFTVIMSIILIAINPREQISRASDMGTKMTAQDVIGSTISYFTDEKKLPWTNNKDCKAELDAGGYLADMPNCIDELLGKDLGKDYLKKSELKEIYVNKCGNSAVLCYSPKSKIENQDAEARFSKFGVNQPGCPGKDKDSSIECYWCKPVLVTSSCTLPPPLAPTPTATPSATLTPTLAPTTTPSPTPTPIVEKKIYDTWNIYLISNGAIRSGNWTITKPELITMLGTYHWNSPSVDCCSYPWNVGRGAPPGTIYIRRSSDNAIVWQGMSETTENETYHQVFPNVTLPADTYYVTDDAVAWSYNFLSDLLSGGSQSGFLRVYVQQ